MWEATRVGGEEAPDFQHFAEAKQKLANLRAGGGPCRLLDGLKGAMSKKKGKERNKWIDLDRPVFLKGGTFCEPKTDYAGYVALPWVQGEALAATILRGDPGRWQGDRTKNGLLRPECYCGLQDKRYMLSVYWRYMTVYWMILGWVWLL